MTTTFYTRSIDGGHGVQTVIADDGVITAQSIGPASGQYHSYTGDGNPELVGRPVSAMRGMGFTKLRGRAEHDAMEIYHNTLMSDY